MREIAFATRRDLEAWMELAREVRGDFPLMDTEGRLREYRRSVLEHMARQQALCCKQEGRMAGVLLFGANPPFISFMAVHPAYRKTGVGTALLKRSMEAFPCKATVSLTTFRADDPRATAARALYKSFGFTAGTLVLEQGYPVQVFTYQKP